MAKASFTLPDGFLWGTATAAHQVEGQSIDSWTHWENLENGKIYQNQKAGLACDWWGGRWEEDFDRMAELGHTTHRLSIAWSRVQPSADRIDDAAVEQYRAMLKGLRDRGIRPMVSLHHFTNPMWLEDEGGWLNNKTVEHFTRWAEIAVEHFGEYVDLWCTFNEPMVYAVQAFMVGFFYPGKRNPFSMYKAAELLLRAHADAYATIKAQQPDSEVGLAKHIVIFEAIQPKVINQLAVRMVHRGFNIAFLDALVTGALKLPLRGKVQIPNLADSYDYVGVNYYQRYRGGFSLAAPQTFFLTQKQSPDAPPAPPMWGEIYPQGLFQVLDMMWKKLRKPIYITETGTPAVDDEIRRWYIAHAVHEIWRAVGFNIPVKGIYYWTLMDNFEWIAAYDPAFHFGLYAVDFETQTRTLRPSGEFYRDISKANGLNSDLVETYIPSLLDKLFPGEPGQDNVDLSSN